MISFHGKRSAVHIARDAERKENRLASTKRAHKQLFIAGAIFAVVIAAASWHAHRVLAARTPDDMPASSIWILTGHSRDSNTKLGLWIGCWKSDVVRADHCRITNEIGTVQYDGDMLPLGFNRVIDDSDLQFAKVDPERIWVRGVNDGAPVPVLTLADGTQLVPVSDREGLQKRLAAGAWVDGMETSSPLATNAPAEAQ